MNGNTIVTSSTKPKPSLRAEINSKQLRILVTHSRTLTGINRPHRSLIGAARDGNRFLINSMPSVGAAPLTVLMN